MKHPILLVWIFLLTACAFAQNSRKSAQPNIVLIISDDHTQQAISAYGSKIAKTPNIDRIANSGVLFNRAYVNNSICGPSRAAILTGTYSHVNGFLDNDNSSYDSSQDQFVNHLQSAGYQTAWIGKYHLGEDPKGFDYWEILPGQGHYYNPDFIQMDGQRVRKEGYVSDLIEDAAESWLEKRNPEKPFCLILGHKATHRTWMPDLQDLHKYDDVVFPLPANFYDSYEDREAAKAQDMSISKTMVMDYDLKMYADDSKDGNVTRMTPAQRAEFDAYYKPIRDELAKANLSGNALTEWKFQRYMRDYLATAESMDRNIGRLLDYLDAENLDENTIVIYVSDQGFYLGEHGWFDKRFMYEESFRTPMMMRYPGVVSAGMVSDHFVMNLDLAPTLLEAAGVKISERMQGKSFLPMLKNPTLKGREALYYHYYEYGTHSVSPHFGIKTDRYKLIRFYRRVESWELFDLEKDPSEMMNLYGKADYAEVEKELKAKLRQLILDYGDEGALKIFETDISTR